MDGDVDPAGGAAGAAGLAGGASQQNQPNLLHQHRSDSAPETLQGRKGLDDGLPQILCLNVLLIIYFQPAEVFLINLSSVLKCLILRSVYSYIWLTGSLIFVSGVSDRDVGPSGHTGPCEPAPTDMQRRGGPEGAL